MYDAADQENDRLIFAVFLASALHAILILGLGFSPIPPTNKASSLEITITQTRSEKEPEDADFFAQANQIGSGTTEDKRELATEVEAKFDDNVIREVHPEPTEAASLAKPTEVDTTVITTQAPATQKAPPPKPITPDIQQEKVVNNTVDQLQRSLEIASLTAQLKKQSEAYAKRPRKRQLTAISAKEARDARYLDEWRRKVERVGNRYYPREAKRRKLYGNLRLMVAVKADGTIHDIEVRQSSGYRILDDAAVAIVRRSSPFAPFPEEISRDTDILEIIRTWKFEPGSLTTE